MNNITASSNTKQIKKLESQLAAYRRAPIQDLINYAIDHNLMTQDQIAEALEKHYSPTYIYQKFIVPVRRERRANY
jgi:hypothetical protein